MVAKEKQYNLITTLFDRYYSQNCKAITYRKITNHTKYK